MWVTYRAEFHTDAGCHNICSHIIQCLFEAFRIAEHFLNIGCPRKYNSYSYQFCHLALKKSKSNTCQVSKKSSWKQRYFPDPLRVTTFNVCSPYKEEQPWVSIAPFQTCTANIRKFASCLLISATFRQPSNKCGILTNHFTSTFFLT